MTFQAGARLGPYEILSAIGAGGMGEVYKARDTRLDRTVAIKILPETLADDPQFRDRFDREARAISQLDHPNICALYDVGEQQGTAYLVMQLLDGETLEARLKKGALPVDQALKVGIEIASALDKAHRAGIVHRDVKPGNVMLTKSGAKLLDFGLAKTGSAVASSSLSMLPTTPPAAMTAQGTILGTFQYMAPEQLEGQDSDARTDIFAFGAVLYEMLTGKKAFEGKSQASLISAIMSSEPSGISTLQPLAPPLIDRIVSTCLAKDPDERFQSARDVISAMKWAADSKEPTSSESRPRPMDRFIRIAAAGLAIASAVLGTLYLLQRRADRPTAPAPAVTRLTMTLPENAPIAATGNGYSLLTFSPDGDQIVYLTPTAGAPLYRRRLDRLEVEAIPGTEGARGPFFSPDGRWLGFVTGRVLKKVGASGGLPATIAEVPFPASRGATWTKDDTIFFAILGGNLWRLPATGGNAAPLVGPEGEGLQRDKEVTRRRPFALPDGKTLLYTSLPTATTSFAKAQDFTLGDIAALDIRSGTHKVLVSGGYDARYVAPGYLTFARGSTVYAARFDANTVQLLGDAVKVIDNVHGSSGNGFADYGISSNGTLVYVPGQDRRESGVNGTTVVWVDRQGHERPLAHWDTAFNQERLSSDGTRLLVHGNNPVSDVGIHEIARGILTRLTSNPSGGTSPIWSADGNQVTYTRPDPSFAAGPYTMVVRASDGTGSEQPLLERPVPIAAESWSPDGGTLAFTERKAVVSNNPVGPLAESDIWLLPARGDRKPIAFATSAAFEARPRFSPDGRWIAYESNESGRDEIFVRGFPDLGAKYQVSTTGGTNAEWSSNGRELIYQEGTAVMSVSVSAGSTFAASVPKKLFEGRRGSVLLAVAPNGQDLLMSGSNDQPVAPPATEIIVIENWTEELKRLVPTK